MDTNQIAGMTHQELMACISDKKKEIKQKLQNGETEPSFSIGAGSFTVKEWDKLLSKVDKTMRQSARNRKSARRLWRKKLWKKRNRIRKCLLAFWRAET